MIFINDDICTAEGFSEKVFAEGLSIYEVVRVFKGHAIFLKDNLVRLANSLKKSNLDIEVESLNLPQKLQRFIDLEQMSEGNLKYVLHFNAGRADEYIYRIPHSYPTEKDYREGVSTLTYAAVRENPGVKYINADLRTLTNGLMAEHGVYEVLLVDREGFITEGSRSNVFFVKGETLYTSPLEYVLPGTSRKRVFEICKDHHVQIEEKRIGRNTLADYDIAFLTGTSPLILPISRIDAVRYQPDNAFLHRLMKWYFALLEG